MIIKPSIVLAAAVLTAASFLAASTATAADPTYMCSRPFDLSVFPSMSRAARRLHSLAPTLVTLPSMSLNPSAPLQAGHTANIFQE